MISTTKFLTSTPAQFKTQFWAKYFMQFTCPHFLTYLTNFADDNFALTRHTCKHTIKIEMQYKLEIIPTWSKDSGLEVNEAKTELCLFYKKTPQVGIILNGTILRF